MKELIGPIRLAAYQKNRASEVLVRAFDSDPVYRQIVPDSDERSRSLRSLFRAVIGYALQYGRVHTTPSMEGIVCWLTPGNTEVTFWRMLRTGLEFQRAMRQIRKDARHQLLDTLAYMDEIHKRLMAGPLMGSHWYLWALGVEPANQGRGIGGKLIKPVLIQADRDRTPCYLETQTERNVAFFQKWGFEIRSDEVVPGQELRLWSMVREPRAQPLSEKRLPFTVSR